MGIVITTTALFLGLLGILLAVLGVILLIRMRMAKIATGALAQRHTRKPGSVLARTKYPEADAFRLRGTFFNLGLALALGLSMLALGWTQYEPKVPFSENFILLEDVLEIDPPRTTDPPRPLPPPPPPVIEEVPDEQVLAEEEPEFIDRSVDTDEAVETPPVQVKKVLPPPPPPPQPLPTDGDDIFFVVEDMPLFPGCENEKTKEEKRQCSDRKVLEYVFKHLKCPVIARENGIEGTAVVQFVIDTDGTVTDVSILKDIGGGCGEEAARVINGMNEDNIKWTPGRQRGRPVKVQFRLPVRFKLQ
ncbi:MAG: energy transducer TonB [Lewinellaceae bacterium]|nr:energy transducer TonB [Lewinellaceae bacterium]